MNAMDRVTSAPRLREALIELHDHKHYIERRRAGERFTPNADGTVSGLVLPRHSRRAYLDAIARQLEVDEENFGSYREALVSEARDLLALAERRCAVCGRSIARNAQGRGHLRQPLPVASSARKAAHRAGD